MTIAEALAAANTRCWHFLQRVERFQSSERRRPGFGQGAGHDDAKTGDRVVADRGYPGELWVRQPFSPRFVSLLARCPAAFTPRAWSRYSWG